MPLNYLIRAASIHLFGYSPFSGRLPSLLFSLAAALGVFILARQLKLKFPLLAMVIFCAMPLQLRYALESRPYSQALAITIWATVVFLAQLKQSRISLAFAYCALALAGLYTQPYSLFVFIAHLLWICSKRRDLLVLTAVPIGLAGIAFIPWDLWVMRLWHQTAPSRVHYQLGFEPLAVLLHELVGGGYAETVLVLVLTAIGLIRRNIGQLFWGFYLIVPIVLALAADRFFGYFFATRQVIAITAPLALLAALGVEQLWRERKTLAVALCSLLLAVCVIGNVEFFRKPREDWQAASLILRQRAEQGGCIIFNPPQSVDLYRFFVPDLSNFECKSVLPSSVLLANNPYENNSGKARRLTENGFKRSEALNLQGPQIDLYRRTEPRP